MSSITLLRHPKVLGEAALYGRTNIACCPRSFAQAFSALGKMAEQFDLIVTSPLQRCALLAEKFSEQSGLPLLVEHDFQEINFGIFDGIPFTALHKEWPILEQFWATPHSVTFDQAEKLAHFNRRVVAAWASLLTSSADKRILVICHGGVIRQIIADCLGLSWQQPKLYRSLQVANNSMTKIDYFQQYQTSSIRHISLPLYSLTRIEKII
ncbi:MAG: alpha-ribazole phosphatase [Psychromonas sp.]|jgi:alpha-ribazole phosphatase|uniref:histidine phosphatase family protein n=1 Tax=Psychromonas sp. TaxID=1884585 RepID=UPI0039E369F7